MGLLYATESGEFEHSGKSLDGHSHSLVSAFAAFYQKVRPLVNGN